jgi:hypothetical protein
MDNGISYGDDQYIATPGTVPGLVKNFKNKRIIRPEELARAEQYGISINVPCTNTRNSEIIADDRYGTQTLFDLDDNTRYGNYYRGDLPAMMFKNPNYRYDNVIPQCRRDEGTADNTMLPVKHCKKGRRLYNEGYDPITGLDRQSMPNWQPCQDGWGGVYPLQERFGGKSGTMSGQEILMIFLLFIIVVTVVYNIMKTRELSQLIDTIKLRT